jgi:urease accessory protein UreE
MQAAIILDNRITSFTRHPHAQHQQTHRPGRAQPVLVKRASTLSWTDGKKAALTRYHRALGFATRHRVRGGDVLLAEDGSMVRVIAAPQTVLRITHCSAHGTP